MSDRHAAANQIKLVRRQPRQQIRVRHCHQFKLYAKCAAHGMEQVNFKADDAPLLIEHFERDVIGGCTDLKHAPAHSVVQRARVKQACVPPQEKAHQQCQTIPFDHECPRGESNLGGDPNPAAGTAIRLEQRSFVSK